MRDPNRIPKILEDLKNIWSKNPDLRLCQLLSNLVYDANILYHVEDDELIKGLKEMYDK
jgi:uncharacterized protein YihD (DUF1040 family)